jgi:hypothetical protein
MNYILFRSAWLRMMTVDSGLDSETLENDINDAYTLFKTDPSNPTVEEFITILYTEYAYANHYYYLKQP